MKTLFILLSLCFIDDIQPEYVQRAKEVVAPYKIVICVTHNPDIDWNAYTEAGLNRIVINTAHPDWKDYKKVQIFNYKEHHSSTDHPDHIIRHEIGHIILARKIGYIRANEVACRFFPIPLARVKKEVGGYAQESLAEFYSEVYAGLCDKKVYPKDIMDLYFSIERGEQN